MEQGKIIEMGSADCFDNPKPNNLNNIFHTQNKETLHEKITFNRNVNGLSFCCECTRNHFRDGTELPAIWNNEWKKAKIIGFDVDVRMQFVKKSKRLVISKANLLMH